MRTGRGQEIGRSGARGGGLYLELGGGYARVRKQDIGNEVHKHLLSAIASWFIVVTILEHLNYLSFGRS